MSEDNKEETKVGEEMMTPPGEEKKKGKAPAEVKEKGVSKKEFAEFQGQVTNALGAIMEKLSEGPAHEVAGIAAAPVPKGDPDNGGPDNQLPPPPAWRKLADEILGPDFRIELELPENGGQKFSIYVPREKSNAHPDYKAMFVSDKRTRELGNTGVKGVKDWLLRVRRNLVQSGIKLPYYEDTQPQLISTR